MRCERPALLTAHSRRRDPRLSLRRDDRELRRGIELIRHRNDFSQVKRLETWLRKLEAAQLWGTLRVPNPENALDKQIAATALLYDLTVVTRNLAHFEGTGVPC